MASMVNCQAEHALINESINFLLEKLNRDFEVNPLSLRVDALMEQLQKFIESQKKIECKKKELETNCLTKSSFKYTVQMLIMLGGVTSAVITIMQANQNNSPPLATTYSTAVSQIITVTGTLFLAMGDVMSNRPATPEANKSEGELPQRILLAIVGGLAQSRDWRKESRDKAQAEFKQCLAALKKITKIPKPFKKRIPKRDKWVSLLLDSLPEESPIKKHTRALSQVGIELNIAKSDLTAGKAEKIVKKELWIDRHASVSSSEERTSESSSENLRDSPPQLQRTMSKPLDPVKLYSEFTELWEELQKMIEMPIKSLRIGERIFSKNGNVTISAISDDEASDEKIQRMLENFDPVTGKKYRGSPSPESASPESKKSEGDRKERIESHTPSPPSHQHYHISWPKPSDSGNSSSSSSSSSLPFPLAVPVIPQTIPSLSSSPPLIKSSPTVSLATSSLPSTTKIKGESEERSALPPPEAPVLPSSTQKENKSGMKKDDVIIMIADA